MSMTETVVVHLKDGFSDSFTVDDGDGALYAISIETGGYGVRKAPDGPMTWYPPADVDRVDVITG